MSPCAHRGRGGDWTIETVYKLFPMLRELRARLGGFLSGGEQQMLTIARTLMGNRELLLLDEPSEGWHCWSSKHCSTMSARRRSGA
jgi:ABC-type branched-subunit amino acid transport system ATPase component